MARIRSETRRKGHSQAHQIENIGSFALFRHICHTAAMFFYWLSSVDVELVKKCVISTAATPFPYLTMFIQNINFVESIRLLSPFIVFFPSSQWFFPCRTVRYDCLMCVCLNRRWQARNFLKMLNCNNLHNNNNNVLAPVRKMHDTNPHTERSHQNNAKNK